MSDIAKGFLADICANPDDDTPRLVFADWLDEQGNAARAEFIRLQIQRARLPKWDAAQVRLRVREAVLLAMHGGPWTAALPKLDGVQWGGFRRGFVAEAKLSGWDALRKSGCFAAAPVQAVSLRWPKKTAGAERTGPVAGLRELSVTGKLVSRADADRLAASRLLSTLRVLDVKGTALGTEGLRRVVASPHLGRLEALRAADNVIGDGVAAALRAAPALGSLQELDLSNSEDAGYYGEDVFTAEGMAELGAWPGLARIRRLDLSGNDFRKGQLRPLVCSPRATGLKELAVSNCHNYEGWGTVLDDAAPKMELDVLDIRGAFREEDSRRLAANRRLRNLKVLRACDVPEEESSSNIYELASGPFMASLRVLEFEVGTADPTVLGPLLGAASPLLHTLGLYGVYFRDEQMIAFAQSPATDTLHELDLRRTNLGQRGAEALGASPHLRSLLVLRVGGNPMGVQAMDALAASPLGRRLLLLDRSER